MTNFGTLIIIVVLAITQTSCSEPIKSLKCETYQFDGKHYNKELLIRHNVGEVLQIAVDWNNGHIYFVGSYGTNDGVLHCPTIVIQDGVHMENITGVDYPTGIVVDQYNSVVYIIESNHLYKVVDDDAKVEEIFEVYYAFWMDVYDRGNYIMHTGGFPKGLGKRRTNKTWFLEPIAELKDTVVHPFTVDRRNNIIFESNGNLLMLNNRTREIKSISAPVCAERKYLVSKKNDVWYINQQNNNIYKVDRENYKAYKIGHLEADHYQAIAFDEEGNILIGLKGSLYRLRKLAKENCGLYANRPKCQIDGNLFC